MGRGEYKVVLGASIGGRDIPETQRRLSPEGERREVDGEGSIRSAKPTTKSPSLLDYCLQQ